MDVDQLVPAGIVLILLGFVLVLAGSVLSGGETDAEAGGVLFIGPVPVVFGSSNRMAGIAAVLGILTLGVLYLAAKGL